MDMDTATIMEDKVKVEFEREALETPNPPPSPGPEGPPDPGSPGPLPRPEGPPPPYEVHFLDDLDLDLSQLSLEPDPYDADTDEAGGATDIFDFNRSFHRSEAPSPSPSPEPMRRDDSQDDLAHLELEPAVIGSRSCQAIKQVPSSKLPRIYTDPTADGEVHKAMFDVGVNLLKDMLRLVAHEDVEALCAMFFESAKLLAAQDTEWMEYLFTTTELPMWIAKLAQMLPNSLLCSQKPQIEDEECPEDIISCDSLSLYKWHSKRGQKRIPPEGQKMPALHTSYFKKELDFHLEEPDLEVRHFSPILLIDDCIAMMTMKLPSARASRVPRLLPPKRRMSDGEELPRKRISPDRKPLFLPSRVASLRGGQLSASDLESLEDGSPEDEKLEEGEIILTDCKIRGGHLHGSALMSMKDQEVDLLLAAYEETIEMEDMLIDLSRNRTDGEVTRMGGGESYRPTARARSPPRADTFRASDRDRERERRSPPASDSYQPSERRRSPAPYRRDRTPPRRDEDRRSGPRDSDWRSRPRSPPRARSPPSRRFSPRRDDRSRRDDDRRAAPRSPRRDDRRRSRSPYDRDRAAPRTRSPLPRRSRSPPSGPRYRGRSRTPERSAVGPSSASWRRRSPSPANRDSDRSGRTSGNTSRRSSPHIHPSRLALAAPALRVEAAARARSPPRSPPTTQLAYRDRERDSARSTPRERSPVRMTPAKSPPRGPSNFRAPTGPGGSRNFSTPARSPGAPSSNSSMSAHNRDSGPIEPPAGPRGYLGRGGGGYRGRGGRGSFGAERGGRPDWGAAPPSRPSIPAVDTSSRVTAQSPRQTPQSPAIQSSNPSPSSIPTGPASTIPTGPRAGSSITSRPALQHSNSAYGARNSSISSASGPRPHPAMANLQPLIPGGRIDPTATGYTPEIAARLKKREEEEVVLREDLKLKEEKLRKSLKTWEKLSRESAAMGLRSELSERHVRMLAGEGVGGAAF